MITERALRSAEEIDRRSRPGQRVVIRCRLIEAGWSLLDDAVRSAIAYSAELGMAAVPGWTLEGVSFPVRDGVRRVEIIVRRS